MKIPIDVELYETPSSTHWFDADGIMHSKAKNFERNLASYKESMDLYRKLAAQRGKDKLCLMADIMNVSTMDKEVRDYLSEEIPRLFKAMALISDKPMESSLVNTFFKISWQRFPIRLFLEEDEARVWLKEFL